MIGDDPETVTMCCNCAQCELYPDQDVDEKGWCREFDTEVSTDGAHGCRYGVYITHNTPPEDWVVDESSEEWWEARRVHLHEVKSSLPTSKKLKREVRDLTPEGMAEFQSLLDQVLSAQPVASKEGI